MAEKIFFGAYVLLLASSSWLFLRARQGSPDHHFMKIQALLWSGVLFGNLPGAFELPGSSLAVGSRVLGGILLLASFVQLFRTKRVRQSWRALQREDGPPGASA